MMYQCWQKEPSDRPSFADLCNSLGKLLEEQNSQLPTMRDIGYQTSEEAVKRRITRGLSLLK